MVPGPLSTAAFLAIVAALAVLLALAARRAAGTRGLGIAVGTLVVLLGGTLALASTGALRRFDSLPPPLLRMMLVLLAANLAFTLSRRGAAFAGALPLAWLVGFQVFRLPVELVLHAWYSQGVLPVQMTYAGRNFDIVTGLLALPLAFLVHRGRATPALLWGFNLLGLALLANIVGVAVASLPGPLQVFTEGPANRIVAEPPYVWLPAFLVQAALFGHLLLFRRLTARARAVTGMSPA
jgi:hypothetical protein